MSIQLFSQRLAAPGTALFTVLQRLCSFHQLSSKKSEQGEWPIWNNREKN